MGLLVKCLADIFLDFASCVLVDVIDQLLDIYERKTFVLDVSVPGGMLGFNLSRASHEVRSLWREH